MESMRENACAQRTSLPVAARRFPRAYPLEPGLWRNLLDDDRAFA